MLAPQQNQFRTVIDLGGYWRFSPDPERRGHGEQWFSKGLPDHAMLIAVPGAWNEQLAERGIMNFVGLGWYETTLALPAESIRNKKLWIRFGAADHHAEVWLNGILIGFHEGGFLPFEVDATSAWRSDSENRLIVAVDSRLSMHTLPQDVDPTQPPYNHGYERRHVFPPTRFDFFPYGGLTRAVTLVITSVSYITDITVRSSLDGAISVTVQANDASEIRVRIVDMGQKEIASASGKPENPMGIQIDTPHLWSPRDPYLYGAHVRLVDHSEMEVDGYNQTFGIREVRVEGDRLMLNNEPLYLLGFGKHEDIPIVGRGHFRPAMLRDFELLRWIGANSFRTSHYPYDEEVMQLADQLGFLIIDEVPAVSLGFWTDNYDELTPLLDTHKRALTALIGRDKNHPSVISWSLVNEPNLWSEHFYQNETSRKYFQEVYSHVKQLDSSRPVISITIPAYSENDVALEACDLIGINRYYAWYTDPCELKKAREQLELELDRIHRKHQKPIILTEFGADTIEGYHATTPQLFTEEFQIAFLQTYCDVIDRKPYCAGTHIWNFADFLTPQNFRRVLLNKKGVFTRTRQPKSTAFAIRDRWRNHPRLHPDHRAGTPDGEFLVSDLEHRSSTAE